MVPDGYYYATPLVLAAVLIGWLASPLWAAPAVLLAAFFLWFFRDPERIVPQDRGRDCFSGGWQGHGCLAASRVNGVERKRISIFLNVFNVHVNRVTHRWSHSRRPLSEGEVPECDGSPIPPRKTSRIL